MANLKDLQFYLDNGFTLVEVSHIDNLCETFVGNVEGDIKTDTDGSKYVTVCDQEDNWYDIDIVYIIL